MRTAHIFGDVDLARDEQIAERAGALPWDADYSTVRVLAGALPEGLAMSGDGNSIGVRDGFERRYAVLGSAASELPFVRLQAIFWYASMHDSEGSFRAAWCSWQAPLRAVTLGLWSLFVPLNYPCFPAAEAEPRLHIKELQRLASAMGGNLLIISGSKGLRIVDQAGTVIAQREGIALRAFVLVDHGPGSMPPPSPAPTSAPSTTTLSTLRPPHRGAAEASSIQEESAPRLAAR